MTDYLAIENSQVGDRAIDADRPSRSAYTDRAVRRDYAATRLARAQARAAAMDWWQLMDWVDDLDQLEAACNAAGEGAAVRTVINRHREIVAAEMAAREDAA